MPITQDRVIKIVQIADVAHHAIFHYHDTLRAYINRARVGELTFHEFLTLVEDLQRDMRVEQSHIVTIAEETAHFRATYKANERRARNAHRRHYLLTHEDPKVREQAIATSRTRSPTYASPEHRASVKAGEVMLKPDDGSNAVELSPELHAELMKFRARHAAPPASQPSPSPTPAPTHRAPLLSELNLKGTGERADVVAELDDDLYQPPNLGDDPFA